MATLAIRVREVLDTLATLEDLDTRAILENQVIRAIQVLESRVILAILELGDLAIQVTLEKMLKPRVTLGLLVTADRWVLEVVNRATLAIPA